MREDSTNPTFLFLVKEEVNYSMHAVEGTKTRDAIYGSTTPLDEKEKMQKMLEKIMKKRGGRNGKKKTQTGR